MSSGTAKYLLKPADAFSILRSYINDLYAINGYEGFRILRIKVSEKCFNLIMYHIADECWKKGVSFQYDERKDSLQVKGITIIKGRKKCTYQSLMS